MPKHGDKFQTHVEERELMRAGRKHEASETVRAILEPIQASTSQPALGDECKITVQLYDSTLLWPDTVGARTVELTFLSSDGQKDAIPLIEVVFSLDTEARTKLYKILSDNEERQRFLNPSQRGV